MDLMDPMDLMDLMDVDDGRWTIDFNGQVDG